MSKRMRDPEMDIFTDRRCDELADAIESYLDFFDRIFILPEKDPDVKNIDEKMRKAKEKVRKLIKKLRAHKVDEVFRSPSEVDSIDAITQRYV